MSRIAALVFAALLFGSVSYADVAVRTLAKGAASPPAKITDLAWLQGEWIGKGLGGEAVEAYSAPLGGAIVGYFRFVKDGKPIFYEIAVIAEEAGSLVLRIKHFNPDMTGWEEKNESQSFKLVALEGQTAYFDGLTYQRNGDTMSAAVLIKHKDGKQTVEQFSYTRVK